MSLKSSIYVTSSRHKVQQTGNIGYSYVFVCNYIVTKDHKEIKDTIKFNGMKQVITSPTLTSRTLIDIEMLHQNVLL